MNSQTSVNAQRMLHALGLKAAPVPQASGQNLLHVSYENFSESLLPLNLKTGSWPELEKELEFASSISNAKLVVAPRLSPSTTKILRDLNINFVDEAGNAYVKFGPVLIDIQGKKHKDFQRSPARAANKRNDTTNLFSPQRARVIFALLSWPELLKQPLRSIAHTAQVSLGQAQSTISLLEFQGYILREGRRSITMLRSEELSQLWAYAFPHGLRSMLNQKELSGDIFSLKNETGSAVYISGEAAVPDLLRPMTLIAYTETDNFNKLIVKNRWKSSEPNNITIREQFWSAPPEDSTLGNAPKLLLIADLLASDEPRQIETAQFLLETSDDQLR